MRTVRYLVGRNSTEADDVLARAIADSRHYFLRNLLGFIAWVVLVLAFTGQSQQ